MEKITKLTKAQKARFPEFVEKWVDIGLSTEPADFDKAIAAAMRAYDLCNLNKPQVVLRMISPYGATLGGIMAWAFLRELVNRGISGKPWSQVRSQVESQGGSQGENQGGNHIKNQIK